MTEEFALRDKVVPKADWRGIRSSSFRNHNPYCKTRGCYRTARYAELCFLCYARIISRPFWKYCQIKEDGEMCGRQLHSYKMCQRHADKVRRSKKT